MQKQNLLIFTLVIGISSLSVASAQWQARNFDHYYRSSGTGETPTKAEEAAKANGKQNAELFCLHEEKKELGHYFFMIEDAVKLDSGYKVELEVAFDCK